MALNPLRLAAFVEPVVACTAAHNLIPEIALYSNCLPILFPGAELLPTTASAEISILREGYNDNQQDCNF